MAIEHIPDPARGASAWGNSRGQTGAERTECNESSETPLRERRPGRRKRRSRSVDPSIARLHGRASQCGDYLRSLSDWWPTTRRRERQPRRQSASNPSAAPVECDSRQLPRRPDPRLRFSKPPACNPVRRQLTAVAVIGFVLARRSNRRAGDRPGLLSVLATPRRPCDPMVETCMTRGAADRFGCYRHFGGRSDSRIAKS